MLNLKSDTNYRTLMLPWKRSVQLSTETAFSPLLVFFSAEKNPAVFENLTRLNSAGVSDLSEQTCWVFISRTSDREWKVAMKELRVEKRDCVESVCPESTVAMRMEWSRLVRRLGTRIAIIPQGEDKEVQWLYWSLWPPHFASFFCTQLYKM